MAFTVYKSSEQPRCPIAVKLDQSEVNAPSHDQWGVVTCDNCNTRFAIGPNRHYGARLSVPVCVAMLEERLVEDHHAGREHFNSYELQD